MLETIQSAAAEKNTSAAPAAKAASARKKVTAGSSEGILRKLETQIGKISDQIAVLQDFCTYAQSDPARCDESQARRASRQIGTSLDAACNELANLREAQQREERRKLSELARIMEGKLDINRALELAEKGASADDIARALVARTGS